MNRSYALTTALSIVFCAIGCPPPEESKDAGADAGPSGESYTFKVTQQTYDATGAVQTPPAVGATIAFESPAGNVLETTTDNQGAATISGIEWSGQGKAAFCAYLENFRIMCRAALTQGDLDDMKNQDSAIEIRLLSVGGFAPSMVTISGTAQHMALSFNMLLVTSPQTVDGHQNSGPRWSLEVPAGKPITLVALEFRSHSRDESASQTFYHWAVVEHEAVTANHEVTIDFDASATPIHFSGSVAMPTGATDTFFHTASYYMTMTDALNQDFSSLIWNSVFIGGVTSMRRTTDHTAIEYIGEYVALPGMTPMMEFSFVQSLNVPSPAWNFAFKRGQPVDGPQDLDLVTPPSVLAPGPAETMFLDDELVWDLGPDAAAHPDASVNIWLFRSDGSPVWQMNFPPGTTRLKLPALPSSVDREVVLGTDVLAAYLQTNSYEEDGPALNWRSQAPGFYVQP